MRNPDSVAQSPVAPSAPRLELTLRAVVLGLVLSIVMGAANVYVGLRAGMTVSASIPAAVMAMLLFRMLFRNSTILEANQVQTCASASSGFVFVSQLKLTISKRIFLFPPTKISR